ncbi:MAG TPA: hypothetical protein VF161_04625 [Steroidobacteraceae bacterium]|jgi:hypothetical protein
MSESRRDPLDELLARVPREVAPERDLWPAIRAGIEAEPRPAERARGGAHPRWFQLAAGVLLVLASSLTTYVLTRQSLQQEAAQIARETLPAPSLTATPASFGLAPEALGVEYVQTRAELDKRFEQRLATLPPVTRAKVERNLAEIRKASSEIAAALAENPSDPLLQELLLSTYRNEIRLLTDVSQLPSTSTRVDL